MLRITQKISEPIKMNSPPAACGAANATSARSTQECSMAATLRSSEERCVRGSPMPEPRSSRVGQLRSELCKQAKSRLEIVQQKRPAETTSAEHLPELERQCPFSSRRVAFPKNSKWDGEDSGCAVLKPLLSRSSYQVFCSQENIMGGRKLT